MAPFELSCCDCHLYVCCRQLLALLQHYSSSLLRGTAVVSASASSAPLTACNKDLMLHRYTPAVSLPGTLISDERCVMQCSASWIPPSSGCSCCTGYAMQVLHHVHSCQMPSCLHKSLTKGTLPEGSHAYACMLLNFSIAHSMWWKDWQPCLCCRATPPCQLWQPCRSWPMSCQWPSAFSTQSTQD